MSNSDGNKASHRSRRDQAVDTMKSHNADMHHIILVSSILKEIFRLFYILYHVYNTNIFVFWTFQSERSINNEC